MYKADSMRKKDRFERVIQYFSEKMPIAETELSYNNPYELIVAVILSAQCTDKRVNMITPGFFELFPRVSDLARATTDDVYQLIKSCSYPNNKAKHLVSMAKVVHEQFNDEIPSSLEELITLPGVGRKTANVILSVAFSKPAMAVDTHVFRVASRIGLTTHAKDPLQAEMQLIKYIPEELIHKAHHWLILHGRYVCLARKPKCEKCGLTDVCNYYSQTHK